jgi:dolichol kinase
VLYFFTFRPLAVKILASLAVTSIALEILRRSHGTTANIFNKIFGPILRSHEREQKPHAVTWFFTAATISAAIFPKYITIMSITISLFSDAAAALIGIRFGSRRFKGKSLEGSLAFFLVAVIVVAAAPKIAYNWGEYLIGIVAAMIGTFAELITVDLLDDNLTVPLSVALAMWALYRLMFPQMNLQFGA